MNNQINYNLNHHPFYRYLIKTNFLSII